MAEYKNLTHEQQLEVFDANKGLVYHIAKRYKCPDDMYEDMLQEGFYGLWKAIKNLDKFDPEKSSLSTWLGWGIMGEMGHFTYKASNKSGLSGSIERAIRNNCDPHNPKNEVERRLFSTATSLYAPADLHNSDGATVADVVGCDDKYDDGLKESIAKLLSSLDDNMREIIVRIYGIGCDPEKQNQICKEYGVSTSTLNRWKMTALEELRNQPDASNLLVYLAA